MNEGDVMKSDSLFCKPPIYSFNQLLWLMKDNKPQLALINAVHITSTRNFHSEDRSRYINDYRECQVTYDLFLVNNATKEIIGTSDFTRSFLEKDLFLTREDLIASLMED